MDTAPVLFDVVLFDLDGTLVSTELFWVDAARAGARRAFEELGLERTLPSDEDWLSMVGLPLDKGFDNVFPDLDPAQRKLLMARCVEEEERALHAGSAALMPGARELLAELRARGVRMGIASNCGRGYLETMLSGLGLSEFVSEARCLDSPGVRDKGDMLADLLATFGTRSAVMVGDRSGDALAAQRNALPHVHLEGPIKPRGEIVRCDARIGALDQLLGVLGGRTRWLEAALHELGLSSANGRALRSLGVTGSALSGVTYFARDAARLLAASGREVRVVSNELWRPQSSELAANDDWSSELDVEGLIARVLEPHSAGQPVAADALGGAPMSPESLLILEGDWLLHPRLRLFLDRTLYLTVPEEVSVARAAARAGEAQAADVLVELRRRGLPRQRRHEEQCDPSSRADLVLDGRFPLGTPPE
jgi:phosphoglycolate phosphatase-like HAD superfamily hydrolase